MVSATKSSVGFGIGLSLLIFFATVNPAGAQSDFELAWPDNDPLWRQTKLLWDDRYNPDAILKCIALWEQLAAKYPSQEDPLAWLCRGYYFMGTRESMKKAGKLYSQSYKYGQAALKLNPNDVKVLAWTAVALSHYDDPIILKPRIEKALINRNPQGIRELPIPTNDPGWQDFIKAWDQRQERRQAETAFQLVRPLYDRHSQDLLSILWMTRVLYYLGYSATEEKERIRYHQEASIIAERAWKMAPKDPAAICWYTINLGRYVDTQNMLTKFKHSPAMMEGLKRLEAEGPFYYYAAGVQFMGLAWARGDWVARKFFELKGYTMADTERLINLARWTYPNFLYLALAQAELSLAQKKFDLARLQLKIIINSDPLQDRLHIAENLIAQNQARQNLVKLGSSYSPGGQWFVINRKVICN